MLAKLERIKQGIHRSHSLIVGFPLAVRQTSVASVPRRGPVEVTFVKEVGKTDIIVYNSNGNKMLKYKYDFRKNQYDLKNDKVSHFIVPKLDVF